jgi:hypothetical protein
MHEAIAATRAGEPAFERLAGAWCNMYALRPGALAALYGHARRARGPFLDVGSGLSTIVLGLAAERLGLQVHALEADAAWHQRLTEALIEHGIEATVHLCEVDAGWYRLPAGLPDAFGFALIDGPQHDLGDRQLAFERLGSRITSAVVMADDMWTHAISRPFNRWVLDTGRVTSRAEGYAIAGTPQ